MTLPNSLPRPPDELKRLEAAWEPPTGWRRLAEVNNNIIGVWYIGTAMLFLVLGGILGLLMRTQLAVPENDFLSQDTYNQFFTTHGTIMMFLFAVPVVEAAAVYLLPAMLATRDLPFPRLSAYAFWAYAIGGLAFFCSLFFGLAPKGGWFMYPPLTSFEQSPGIDPDFWLLGIGFIEISAIAGAIEILVGVLKTRPPGMTIDKMPVYVWAMLVFALMIVFGFPPLILGTILLELERAFHWPFFIASKGGDPLLWQHLFWLFGHPEVYIIFLPAAGMVSMILPTMARTRLVGYTLVVLALLGTGFLSFGLWVHHMFATGIPYMSLAFFSAASMAVTIPSGIQVFAWIATLGAGKPKFSVPLLFCLGFLFIFTLGGLTGVMVAVVPFDWQVHDTYFVVAHFHYVLIGGMVFPLFAAFYYWVPTLTGEQLSEKLGKWVFWLMFVGFNVTFFPMHITGLLGMPRRVWTYPKEFGWGELNMLSTIGAFTLAAGIALFFFDALRKVRLGTGGENVWKAGTLEWLPMEWYAARSIPQISSREPLWDNPKLSEEVESGQHYLPGTITGMRETLITSPIEAKPQYVLVVPGPSFLTVFAAAGTAAFFLLLTVQLVYPALACGVFALAMVLAWMWETDRAPILLQEDVGGGYRLPTYMAGPSSQSWWAMVVLALVAGSTFASLIFSYLFVWTITEGPWPPAGVSQPSMGWGVMAVAMLAASSAAIHLGSASLSRNGHALVWLCLLAALAMLLGGWGAELQGLMKSGLRPQQSAYGAVVYTIVALQGFFCAVLAIMALYTLARSACGLLDKTRRQTFDSTMILWHYTTAQGIIGFGLIHLFPLATDRGATWPG